MKINNSEHTKHPWVVHELLSDFELEDVWQFPVVLQPHHTLSSFRSQFTNSTEELAEKGMAGVLFRFRTFLGRIFKWDEKTVHKALVPGSIRERYAQANNLTFADLPDPGKEDFIPVYDLPNESMAEIENATVHAAMHLGRVPLQKDAYAVQMAVYVKPKGFLGKFYMLLIKPFRLLIVYPTMMRMAGKKWRNYLESKS